VKHCDQHPGEDAAEQQDRRDGPDVRREAANRRLLARAHQEAQQRRFEDQHQEDQQP
jgi:hypothetical protein